MRKHIHARSTTHDLAYYHSVLAVFIGGLKNRLTHQAISDHLNAARITTPVGLEWTREIVKTTLKRIRCHADLPKSKIHTALLELILTGQITTREALPLFRERHPALL